MQKEICPSPIGNVRQMLFHRDCSMLNQSEAASQHSAAPMNSCIGLVYIQASCLNDPTSVLLPSSPENKLHCFIMENCRSALESILVLGLKSTHSPKASMLVITRKRENYRKWVISLPSTEYSSSQLNDSGWGTNKRFTILHIVGILHLKG